MSRAGALTVARMLTAWRGSVKGSWTGLLGRQDRQRTNLDPRSQVWDNGLMVWVWALSGLGAHAKLEEYHMKRWILVGLLAMAGCGATGSAPAPSVNNDDVGVVGTDESEGATQPVPLGSLDPIGPVLSWGSFSGLSETVFGSGGPVEILSFVRLEDGHYLIEYDIPLLAVFPVAVVATGLGGEFGDEASRPGLNFADIVSAGELLFYDDGTPPMNLIVEVFNFSSGLDPDTSLISLAPIDGLFSLVIFGNVRDLGF